MYYYKLCCTAKCTDPTKGIFTLVNLTNIFVLNLLLELRTILEYVSLHFIVNNKLTNCFLNYLDANDDTIDELLTKDTGSTALHIASKRHSYTIANKCIGKFLDLMTFSIEPLEKPKVVHLSNN